MARVVVDTKLYPGIAEALGRLNGIGALAVATNKPEKISRRLLEALEIDTFFAAVIGGDTCARCKPDPMVLQEAARRSGFDAATDRAVMIGDTAADIKLGRAFGAAAVWAAWGYVESPGEAPDFVARSPAELPTLVRTALGKRP
ncbi:MAG TPA: HAD-IA family hydrolase [Candidatus Manganitrophaceae bacterium]